MHVRFRWVRVSLVAGALLVLFLVGACDSWQAITFVNHASSRVKVDLRAVPLDYSGTPTLRWDDAGDIIEAGQSKQLLTPVQRSRESRTRLKYTMVAVTEDNEVVLARVFTWDELHDAEWRVIIPAKT